MWYVVQENVMEVPAVCMVITYVVQENVMKVPAYCFTKICVQTAKLIN